MKGLLRGGTALAILFAYLPVAIIVLASFTPGSILSIPTGLPSLRWYAELPNHPEFLSAFVLSVQLGLGTAALAILLGTPAAVALTRYEFPGRGSLGALCVSPLSVPVVVTGIALLQFLNPIGLDGTFTGLLVGHVVLTLPYVVRSVSTALLAVPRGVELAAQDLGAGPLRTFVAVTLPLIRTGVTAGGVMAFLVSFDTFTLSFFLAGPRFRTLPLEIYNYTVYYIDPLVAAVSTLLVGFSVLIALVVDRRFGLKTLLSGGE